MLPVAWRAAPSILLSQSCSKGKRRRTWQRSGTEGEGEQVSSLHSSTLVQNEAEGALCSAPGSARHQTCTLQGAALCCIEETCIEVQCFSSPGLQEQNRAQSFYPPRPRRLAGWLYIPDTDLLCGGVTTRALGGGQPKPIRGPSTHKAPFLPLPANRAPK